MKALIIPHNNSDTDAIVSAIVLEDFFKKIKLPYFKEYDFQAKRGGDLNKEVEFILKHFKQKQPLLIKSIENKKVFLVDHGSFEESFPGCDKAEILGILDHHKLGGIKTHFPVFYRSEPVGATSTVLSKMFLENNFKLTKKRAGLLLAGVLSDTFGLTSPTTTLEDKRMVKILSRIANENIQKLTKKIFEMKSDISDISTTKLINKDYKEFQAGKTKFGIGVFETVDTKKAKERDLLVNLKKIKKEKKIDLIFFVLIDILKNDSEMLLLEEEKKVAEKAFNKKEENNYIFLPGVSSRKKQILPPLAKYLEKK